MYTPQDAHHFGIKWTAVPCKRGEVRVSMPHLLHSAKGPGKRVCRTLMPWFVALQDDFKTLKVAKGGTWSMLLATHRDLLAPSYTLSKLAN